MKHYYKAKWEWFREPSGRRYWRAPGGNNIGVVDLRSNTQAGKSGGVPDGFGVFAYSEPQSIEGAEYLGTDSSVVADLVWTKLTIEADPTGKDAPKPLTGKLGKEVALYLAGEKLKSEAFTEEHKQRTVNVFQSDYRENVGKYPKALLQKWVGAKMKEIYGEMSNEKAKLLVPVEHRKGVLWKKPATTITDAFTDTDGTALESHSAGGFSWSKLAGNGMMVQTNKLQRNATTGDGDRDYRADSDLSSDDMYAKATVGTLTSGFDCAVSVRFSFSARTHYQTEWGDGFRRISKFIAGSHSVLQSDGSANSAGDICECRVNGSTVQAFRNGSQVLTNQTDTTITGHLRAGLSIYNDESTWDIFEAGDLGAAAYSIVATAISFTQTNQNSLLKVSRKLITSVTTYSLSTVQAIFNVSRLLTAQVISYTITGYDILINYTGTIAHYILSAAVTNYTLTAFETNIVLIRKGVLKISGTIKKIEKIIRIKKVKISGTIKKIEKIIRIKKVKIFGGIIRTVLNLKSK